jgi:hypothetical protein
VRQAATGVGAATRLCVRRRSGELGRRVPRQHRVRQFNRNRQQWALEHDLPYFDDQVHFPDLRIEYEELDGRRDHENVEVLTVHYRGAHGAAAARSGFTSFSGFSARIGGHSGGGRGGGRNGGLAEEFWR